MRVQLITQLFDPENAIKGLSFVKELSSYGYNIEVVTTYPSYPGGKIYPGYKMRFFQSEEIDGVRVVRLPSYISHGKSSLGRLFSYATFCLSAFVYCLLFSSRPNVIYSYYPPMLGGIAGALLGIFKRCPFIYDVQDLWPEALSATGVLKDSRLMRFIDWIISWVYKRAAAIVVLSDGYKETLISKGVPANKIHRIYNWCDESRIHQATSSVCKLNKHFDIAYAGNLGPAQALGFVLEAARKLQEGGHCNIRFLFIGDGIECNELKQQAASLGLSNVVFKGRVPPEQVGVELQAADALLVHLADEPVFSITIPSKTQAYMALGKPILMAVAGESAQIIEEASAGVISRPCSPDDIASAALLMSESSPAQLASFGACARKFYIDHMSKRNGVEKVAALIKGLIQK